MAIIYHFHGAQNNILSNPLASPSSHGACRPSLFTLKLLLAVHCWCSYWQQLRSWKKDLLCFLPFSPVLRIKSRITATELYPQSFFFPPALIFWKGLLTWPRLALKLGSSCLSPMSVWDYRPILSYPGTFLPFNQAKRQAPTVPRNSRTGFHQVSWFFMLLTWAVGS